MADTLETATFVEFQQSVAMHFQCPVNTACAIWDLRHRQQRGTESASEFLATLRDIIPDCGYDAPSSWKELALALLLGCRSESAQLEMLKVEPELDAYFRILESDEQSQVDMHTFQSGASSASPYPPVSATYNHTRAQSHSQSERGRGRVGTTCGNCGQIGHSSGAASCPARRKKCRYCQRANHWETMCQMKRQSQKTTG